MKIAFALFRYFPYGGLQRDFYRCAEIALARGHEVTVLLARREAPLPAGCEVVELPVGARSNHGAMAAFAERVAAWRRAHPAVRLIGFNRIPGLDIYFAADTCFAAQLAERGPLAALLPRYRTFLRLERALMADPRALLLFLNALQRDQYLAHYGLAPDRYRVLPPGVRQDRRPGPDSAALRAAVRAEFDVTADRRLVLFLGSGFRVKGLERALRALAALPAELARRIVFVVAGADDPAPFRALAARVQSRVVFAGARDDVPALLQGADLLLHPAHRESAGMVLAEAIVAGLPVLTTDTCGYAGLVREADAGIVVPSPFDQAALDTALRTMLESGRERWRTAALAHAGTHDLFGMHERVVDAIEEYGRTAS